MTNEAKSGLACMDCRKEIALVRATNEVAKYECKHCGLTQYEFERNGVTTWRKQDLSFNGWVHGGVPS